MGTAIVRTVCVSICIHLLSYLHIVRTLNGAPYHILCNPKEAFWHCLYKGAEILDVLYLVKLPSLLGGGAEMSGLRFP